MTHWDVPYWATLPVSAAVCAGLGFLVGWPALRLSGPYLALVTLALATAVPQVLSEHVGDELPADPAEPARPLERHFLGAVRGRAGGGLSGHPTDPARCQFSGPAP